MNPFAISQDVANRWRPLTAEELSIVDTLILDASDIIRVRFPDVDARIVSGALAQSTVVRVVSGMVRRAMLNRDSEGITQGSETVGPFAHSQTFANPNGNLYLSADDIRALELDGFSPKVRMGWLA